MGNKKIDSVQKLLDIVGELDAEEDEVLLYRGNNGMKKIEEILPSIYYRRKNGKSSIEKEDKLYWEILRLLPAEFGDSKSTFDNLVKMRHYTLPTRLLDITYNPLVSLYFSCGRNNEGNNGELIVFKIKKNDIKNYDSDTVSILSNLCKRPFDFTLPEMCSFSDANDWKEQFNEDHSIELLLHDIRSEKPHFKALIEPKDLARVVCVNPKLTNERLIRQSGAFLLFGIDKKKEEPAKIDDSLIAARLEVEKCKKEEILKQLSQVNITEATLFPELENVTQYLLKEFLA